MEYFFYDMPPTPNKIWEDKSQQNTTISVTTQLCFIKSELQDHNYSF